MPSHACPRQYARLSTPCVGDQFRLSPPTAATHNHTHLVDVDDALAQVEVVNLLGSGHAIDLQQAGVAVLVCLATLVAQDLQSEDAWGGEQMGDSVQQARRETARCRTRLICRHATCHAEAVWCPHAMSTQGGCHRFLRPQNGSLPQMWCVPRPMSSSLPASRRRHG